MSRPFTQGVTVRSSTEKSIFKHAVHRQNILTICNIWKSELHSNISFGKTQVCVFNSNLEKEAFGWDATSFMLGCFTATGILYLVLYHPYRVQSGDCVISEVSTKWL